MPRCEEYGIGSRGLWCYECGWDDCCPYEKLGSMSSTQVEEAYAFFQKVLFSNILTKEFKRHIKTAMFMMESGLSRKEE